jgi:hypothetical protein
MEFPLRRKQLWSIETQEICEEMGALWFKSTTDTAERKRLWHARHHSYEIMVRMHRQAVLHQHVAVPISATRN